MTVIAVFGGPDDCGAPPKGCHATKTVVIATYVRYDTSIRVGAKVHGL